MPHLDDTLLALADPARRRVVDLLRRGPRRSGELAAALELAPPAMSKHLRVLRRCGLVEEERQEEDARVRLYRLRRRPFTELRDWVDRMEASWTDQLDSSRQEVEKRGATGRAPGRAGRGTD